VATVIVPVLHWHSRDQALRHAEMVLEAGLSHLMLIDMEARNDGVLGSVSELSLRYPELSLGLNLLGVPAVQTAVDVCRVLGATMTWTDQQLTHTSGPPVETPLLPLGHTLFCGVAFKYQRPEPRPGEAALRALALGMVPTTSGRGTGMATDTDLLRAIREEIGPDAPLAVASGVTPENVEAILPFVTHILVSTGISSSFIEIDPERLALLAERVR